MVVMACATSNEIGLNVMPFMLPKQELMAVICEASIEYELGVFYDNA